MSAQGPSARGSYNVTPRGDSPSTTMACLTAVKYYSEILQRVQRGDITHENAIDAWTTYVNAVGATPDGHNDDVASVLSELYHCLLRFAPPTPSRQNGHHSPLNSSTQLATDEESSNGRASAVRNRLRPSKLGVNLSPHSIIAQAGNPHAPFDADPSSPNPRRNSFRGGPHALGGSGIFAGSIEAASPRPNELPEGSGANAPEDEALTGGLSDDECIGFRLE